MSTTVQLAPSISFTPRAAVQLLNEFKLSQGTLASLLLAQAYSKLTDGRFRNKGRGSLVYSPLDQTHVVAWSNGDLTSVHAVVALDPGRLARELCMPAEVLVRKQLRSRERAMYWVLGSQASQSTQDSEVALPAAPSGEQLLPRKVPVLAWTLWFQYRIPQGWTAQGAVPLVPAPDWQLPASAPAGKAELQDLLQRLAQLPSFVSAVQAALARHNTPLDALEDLGMMSPQVGKVWLSASRQDYVDADLERAARIRAQLAKKVGSANDEYGMAERQHQVA